MPVSTGGRLYSSRQERSQPSYCFLAYGCRSKTSKPPFSETSAPFGAHHAFGQQVGVVQLLSLAVLETDRGRQLYLECVEYS